MLNMFKLILESPLYTEVFGKAMLVFIPVCMVFAGIVAFKVLRYVLKMIWYTLHQVTRDMRG